MLARRNGQSLLDWVKAGPSGLCAWVDRRPGKSMGPWDKKVVNLIEIDEIDIDVPRSMKGIEEQIDNLQELFENLIKFADDDSMAKIMAPTLKAQTKLIDKAVDDYIKTLK